MNSLHLHKLIYGYTEQIVLVLLHQIYIYHQKPSHYAIVIDHNILIFIERLFTTGKLPSFIVTKDHNILSHKIEEGESGRRYTY